MACFRAPRWLGQTACGARKVAGVRPEGLELVMWDRYEARDDNRNRDSAWDRSLGGRGSTSNRNRNDARDSRDAFTKDLDLPRGRERRPVRERDRV